MLQLRFPRIVGAFLGASQFPELPTAFLTSLLPDQPDGTSSAVRFRTKIGCV
jgi:hypothetical protein